MFRPALPFSGALLLSVIAIPAWGATPKMSPSSLQDLIQCRNLADASEKLACFEQATDKLVAAEAARDIVIVNRAQVRETQKSLFGLALPKLSLFGGGKGAEQELSEISAKVASVSEDRNGDFIVRLDDGARWRQVDEVMLARMPRPGSSVLIKRGTLGSFRMNVDGQSAVRVVREN